jgi:hypothetical protein
MNWLRVLGTTETPHIDQGVRHQFHLVVALLDGLKPEQQPLACVLPRTRPLYSIPSRMHCFIEQAQAPPLGTLALARILLDVRHHPSMEDRLAIRLRIEPTIESERRTFQPQPRELCHTLERFETRWE